MGPQFTRSLTEILRSTLQRLEETSDFRQDDVAVIELKKHIVRAIAELEISKAGPSFDLKSVANKPEAVESPAPAEFATHLTKQNDNASIEIALAAANSAETSVSEPATESTELPLLAENGTAT